MRPLFMSAILPRVSIGVNYSGCILKNRKYPAYRYSVRTQSKLLKLTLHLLEFLLGLLHILILCVLFLVISLVHHRIIDVELVVGYLGDVPE